MRTCFEIVRFVESSWFDAEGYERAPAVTGASPAVAGYYVLFGDGTFTTAPDEPAPTLGPFATERAAGEAARLTLAIEACAGPTGQGTSRSITATDLADRG